MQITKIVITGGPCGGKSSAMKYVREAFEPLGYTVIVVPETATELIGGGVTPLGCNTRRDFQYCQLQLQLKKEEIYAEAGRRMPGNKLLLICDRGAIDSKAYQKPADYYQTLSELHLDEVQLRESYDAVFHLVTAADGALEYYTLANNAARTETPEEAVGIDRRTRLAWAGHPYLRVIDNSTGFEEKMRRLIAEIKFFLDFVFEKSI